MEGIGLLCNTGWSVFPAFAFKLVWSHSSLNLQTWVVFVSVTCSTGRSRKTRGLKPDWWKRTKMYINIKINQSVKLLILIWGKFSSLSDEATVRETAVTDRIHQPWQLEWTLCDTERLEENVCEKGKSCERAHAYVWRCVRKGDTACCQHVL